MQTQQPEQEPDSSQTQPFPWLRLGFVALVLLCVAIGTTLWIYLGSDAAIIFGIIFTAFGLVFAFLQLTPSLFSKKSDPIHMPQIIIHTNTPTVSSTQEGPTTSIGTTKDQKNTIQHLPPSTTGPSVQRTPRSPDPSSANPSDSHTYPHKLEVVSPDVLDELEEKDEENQPKLFTSLDVGTAFAKAIIVQMHDDEHVEILGVGRHPQSFTHMSDGIVTDIPGVIANCNEALIKAEMAAGGVVAPAAFIGIAGELVKGSSTTLSSERRQPKKPISPEEFETLITRGQQELLKRAKESIAAETGYKNIQVRLVNAAIISVSIDGQPVTNPIGFSGGLLSLSLFSAFAPLMQFNALETVAQGLDLTLTAIVSGPYALARLLSTYQRGERGAIFIDIGGGTTDIALAREGGIEGTRMFAFGGRTLTRRIASEREISLREAERLKISYSNGEIKGKEYDEIKSILAPECQTWMDSVELLLDELAQGEVLPAAIFMVGGGAALPDLYELMDAFPWTGRLPFSRKPRIRLVQPGQVTSILNPRGFSIDVQDITPMALAYQALDMQHENDAVENAVDRVINNLQL